MSLLLLIVLVLLLVGGLPNWGYHKLWLRALWFRRNRAAGRGCSALDRPALKGVATQFTR